MDRPSPSLPQRPRNVLFILCDQLRADYLSCYGHGTLRTPNIDALARRGVRFERAYCQSPNCGPSRASFYSGRYVFSHGATWNFTPLPLGEQTLGDHLRASDMRVAVVGKTHMYADRDGMQRLAIPPQGSAGQCLAEAGFEPYERDDGIHPDNTVDPELRYNAYLRSHGMDGANPWHTWANAAMGPDGEIASGWYFRNAHLPTRAADEHGETAYMTRRAMQFMEEQGDRPWVLHLSYIKPHWPYIVQAPYHAMYGREDVQAPIRAAHERHDEHPVYRGFRNQPEGLAFSRDADRLNVIPTYMGLVRQIDDWLGKLFEFMNRRGLLDNTLIVFSSDHGDFLGDHWLGEKEFMYESGVRIPLIVSDPTAPQGHGVVTDALVEAVDVVPTILDILGRTPPAHWVEGRSLRPILHREAESVREVAISELDYSIYGAARELGLPPRGARMVMARSDRYKYVHFDGLPPQLFDLTDDPHELYDLGRDPAFAGIREEHQSYLFDWMRARRNRVTITDETITARSGPANTGGVVIGQW